MDSKEFMVGNIVADGKGNIRELSGWDIYDMTVKENNEEKIINIQPILLTEELAIRLGFERKEEFIKGLWLMIKADLSLRFIGGSLELWNLDKIDWYHEPKIHQVQNLHKALSGEELTLKE